MHRFLHLLSALSWLRGAETGELLEELANRGDRQGTRRAWLCGAYAMLFDLLRDKVKYDRDRRPPRRSLGMWHGYFPRAKIYGIDISLQHEARIAANELGSRDGAYA